MTEECPGIMQGPGTLGILSRLRCVSAFSDMPSLLKCETLNIEFYVNLLTMNNVFARRTRQRQKQRQI